MKKQSHFPMGNFEVVLKDGEDQEVLIRKFIRKTKKEKLVDEIMERSYYEKPSNKRKKNEFRKKLLFKKLNKERRELEKVLDEKVR